MLHDKWPMRIFRAALVALALAFLASSVAAIPALAQESQKPEDEVSLAIVQSICPKQVRTETLKNGTAYGCGGCPAFTSFSGQAPTQSKEPDFELRKVLKGSFTRPGTKELLAEFFGCEPHASNFGGTLLLDESGPKIKRVRYLPGIVGIVRTYRLASGKDIVISQGGYTGQGESTGWVSTYDFSSKPDPAEHMLIRVDDNSLNYCERDRVKIDYLSKLEFQDLNGDGRPDLRVAVTYGNVKVPARFQGHCDMEWEGPTLPQYTIDFLFDGTTFHVTPATAATLRRVSAKQE